MYIVTLYVVKCIFILIFYFIFTSACGKLFVMSFDSSRVSGMVSVYYEGTKQILAHWNINIISVDEVYIYTYITVNLS